ncbi:MAG: response regulator [Deltaproteobacteria bacterium]|nr:response regulator [Deltaproteobacteria bacterium]
MHGASLDGLRVLLVEPDAASAGRLARGLTGLGARAEPFSSARHAIERLREGRLDAVVLAVPLPDADWIGLVALVKEGPEPPALVVLDGAGVAPALARALPAARGTDAVLERGAKAAAIAEAIAAAVARGAAVSAGDSLVPEALQPAGSTLPALLVELRRRAETGVLEVRAEGVCTRIALRAGAPVFAEGGALRETLGRMLLRHGTLSEADYLRVIERMTERLMESETTRMGEVLVELGLLGAEEVFAALSAQVREKIVSCFRWQRFDHSFEPCEALPEELLAVPCPPLETLLLEGLRAHFGPERLEPILAPHASHRPALRGGLAEVATRFHLAPAEQRLARSLDGARTLAAIRAAAPLDAVHAAQVLAALVLADAVDWADATSAPAAPGPAPGREVSPPRPATAAPAPARSQPPATPASSPSPEHTARSLARMRHVLAQAARKPLDPKSAPLEAERAFRQGLALLQQSALPGALRAFGRACALKGDEPEYRMYEAWVEVLAARDDAARAVARAKAGACAQRVLARDAEAVRAHTILGQLAVATGDIEAAERHYRAALRTAPEDRDALRGLRLLERRRAPG